MQFEGRGNPFFIIICQSGLATQIAVMRNWACFCASNDRRKRVLYQESNLFGERDEESNGQNKASALSR